MSSRCSLKKRVIQLGLLGLILNGVQALIADEPDNQGHLKWTTGDYARGSLLGSGTPNHIDWQCDAFDRPLSVDVVHVQRMETGNSVITRVIDRHSEFQFNLNGSNTLVGTLVAADEATLTIHNEALGEVVVPKVQLSQIRRIEPPSEILFSGFPAEPAIQKQAVQLGWKVEGQSIVANKSVASLRCPVKLAEQSRIDLKMSWDGSPQFVVALGVDDQGASDANAPDGLNLYFNRLEQANPNSRSTP